MGRPRKEKTKTDELTDKFSAAFEEKFGDKPVLKTPLHFFEWIRETSGGNDGDRSDLLERFEEYCRRTRARATWRNAAQWWMTGKIAKEKAK